MAKTYKSFVKEYAMGLQVPATSFMKPTASMKLKKKDIIKLENKFLEEDDTNKLAVIASSCTINIIKNFQLVEKRLVSLPDQIIRIFRCSNPACITNSKEHLESVMDVVDKDGLVLKCRYCSRMLDVNQLKYS